MAIGWISVHRSIFDCWVWKKKPFSMGQAWIDLLLLANHEDKKFVFGRQLIEVKRGSFITSEVKLMDRWGWGKGKTRAFLSMLESDSMIIKKSDRRRTTITIVKYDSFQDMHTNNGPITDHKRTDGGLITDTNNNDNNVNNVNNKKSRAFAPPSLEEVRDYCQKRNNQVDPESFISFYESKGWMIGKNKMKDWQAAVRTWERSRTERASPKKDDKVHNYEHERNYSDSFLDQLGQRLARN